MNAVKQEIDQMQSKIEPVLKQLFIQRKSETERKSLKSYSEDIKANLNQEKFKFIKMNDLPDFGFRVKGYGWTITFMVVQQHGKYLVIRTMQQDI